MTDVPARARLRALPAVDQLLHQAADLVMIHGHSRVAGEIRSVLEERRRVLVAGNEAATDPASVLDEVGLRLEGVRARPPRRVINATGVVVHTNLGRAPLSAAAVDAMVGASGYCDLEFDLETGARGSRNGPLESVLVDATGGEAAFAVNNAAAALVLVVAVIADGRGVVVSRGELIEIGGSFRLPDMIASAGARLVEVGTTNRTRASDYTGGDDVGLLLKMHPSNYRVTGFTEAPSVADLSAVARERGVPLVYDVGSGMLDRRHERWTADEPTLRGALAAGADVVIASGDKLLGGPQAGVIAGRADVVDRCRRHPLARALRLDKLRVAALMATVDAHVRGRADDEVPVWRMLTAAEDHLAARCDKVAAQVSGAAVGRGGSVPGGGSAPGTVVDSPVVRLRVDDAQTSARALRQRRTPIIVRVERNELVVDLRTVDPDDDAAVSEALGTC